MSHEIYVRNILHIYTTGPDDLREAGLTWYDETHADALEWAAGDAWKGAGVIAAYSPLTPWDRNKELARTSLFWGGARTESLGNSVRAAQRIIDGEHTLDVLKGDKVRAFAAAIADPANSKIATIDRHAHDIAIGYQCTDNNRKIGKRLFRAMSDAYVTAAEMAGIGVPQMQAATWCIWRDLIGLKMLPR